MKRYDESQKVYQRALEIRMHALGDHDPAVAETMASYANVLRPCTSMPRLNNGGAVKNYPERAEREISGRTHSTLDKSLF